MKKALKLLFSTLLLLSWVQTSTAKEPISAKKFRDIVAAKIAKKHPTACIEPQDEWTLSIGVIKDACGDIIMSIDNSYGMYMQKQDDLPWFTNNLANTATNALNSLSNPPPKPKKEQLSIVLRHKGYLEYLGKEGTPNRSIWKPFFGDLIALMVINESKSVKSISAEDISSLQLDEKNAWKIASNNLRNNIGKLDKEYIEGLTHVYAQSGFATGLLWLPETCAEEKDTFFAMVIDRHSYIYASMNDKKASATLFNLAGNLVIAKESLSDNILLCEHGTWQALSLSLKDSAWKPIE